jgi:4-hydroxy-tetrahydrodipicolinate reductase
MRIALVGYGKMGLAVEQAALARGHTITHRVNIENREELAFLQRDAADAIIEFTHPSVVVDNLEHLLPLGIPTVVGTTGWYVKLEYVQVLSERHACPMVYSANFSIGMNLMFRLTEELTRLMNQHSEFDPYVEERHHRHKADAPGGSALALAKRVLAGLDRKTSIADPAKLATRPPKPEELSVSYTRAGDIPGDHTVAFTSKVEKIELHHTAYGRDGFALGAVLAAEWLQSRTGFHTFADVLDS